jgi:hypothetical protein
MNTKHAAHRLYLLVLGFLVLDSLVASRACFATEKLYPARTTQFKNYSEFLAAVAVAKSSKAAWNPVGNPPQVQVWPATEANLQASLGNEISSEVIDPRGYGETKPCPQGKKLSFLSITVDRSQAPSPKNQYSFKVIEREDKGANEEKDCVYGLKTLVQFFQDP